jgi:LysR family nitrogen assimilation transcriptional regulator
VQVPGLSTLPRQRRPQHQRQLRLFGRLTRTGSESPRMEFRQFKYFLEIADRKSLSRAAEQLHIAQSALSRQVAELESELGVKLLVRSRNGVTTTEAGQVFYEYAQGILKQIRDAREAVLRSSDTVVGSVVVALPQSP